jgi:hypothetical protein
MIYCNFTVSAENDQCVENPEICDVNANCDYNNGSYVCQCAKGFIGDGQNNCTGNISKRVKISLLIYVIFLQLLWLL